MDLEQSIRGFASLSETQQVLVLARFAYELTILARESYGPEDGQVGRAPMIRSVNELQHRITAAIVARLVGDSKRFPDDVLVRMCIDTSGNPLATSAGPAFSRVLAEVRGPR